MLLNEFEVPKPRWKGADQNIVPAYMYQMTLTHPTKDGLMVAHCNTFSQCLFSQLKLFLQPH